MLRKRKLRPAFLSFEAALTGAGGLVDSSSGWSKYELYLQWLAEDEPAMKAMLFDRMSKGWALGGREFKESLLEDEKRKAAAVELGDVNAKEAREIEWEQSLIKCFDVLRISANSIVLGRKSEDWKVAIARFMKLRRLCRNGWLASHLNMGSESGVSRYVSQMLSGDRPNALALYERLVVEVEN